jgi:hypothetical protein
VALRVKRLTRTPTCLTKAPALLWSGICHGRSMLTKSTFCAPESGSPDPPSETTWPRSWPASSRPYRFGLLTSLIDQGTKGLRLPTCLCVDAAVARSPLTLSEPGRPVVLWLRFRPLTTKSPSVRRPLSGHLLHFRLLKSVGWVQTDPLPRNKPALP